MLLIFGSPIVRAVMLVYSIWCFVDRTPSRGGWNLPWLKKFCHELSVYKYAFAFFGDKSSIVKTCELDPKKNYVFAYHPHGIIGLGAGFTFGTGGAGFDQLYPGLNVSLMTLKQMFFSPFYREWLMAHGLVSCGRNTCLNILRGPPGRSLCLAVGGAREAIDAIPHVMDLTLKSRKGFVRVAVQTGASIVPVIGFGENELFNQLNSGPIREVQNTIMDKLGFFLPLFWGRGIFNYTMGLLPHRKQLNIIIGSPIDCPKIEDMNTEEGRSMVNEVHEKYIIQLHKLYDDHKHEYLREGETPPEMIFK